MINKITIPAGRSVLESVSESSVFFVISANGDFQVKPGGMNKIDVSQGDGFGNPGGAKFTKLTFYNTTVADIDVTYWADNSEFKTPDANVQNNVAVTSTLTNNIADCADALANQFLKAANAGNVTVFANAGTKFRKAIVMGLKSEDGTVNVGAVQIGAVNNTNKLPIVIPSGGEYVLEPPLGCKWDFGSFYFKVANNNDGIVVLWA